MKAYENWFTNIVGKIDYLGKDLAKEAWNYQQKEIDKLKAEILKLKSDYAGLKFDFEELEEKVKK